jgi:hypothetical protein
VYLPPEAVDDELPAAEVVPVASYSVNNHKIHPGVHLNNPPPLPVRLESKSPPVPSDPPVSPPFEVSKLSRENRTIITQKSSLTVS